ncbi:MAG: YeeE/YedE thiosulfate transporter family protein [Candidatus Eisenbacteria bacterium]|nr:YeeE/YedE thiosulfate transporter family protein [Candidatus Eisenbacteria bacterium]
MPDWLRDPWPWYVAGPLLGLIAPLLLWLDNKLFGISSNLRHVCAAILPGRMDYFRYDWRREGGWNLAFALGIVAGGYLAGNLLANPEPVGISTLTRATLTRLGVTDFSGLVPADHFAWVNLLSLQGLVLIVGGGLLVGFGTAWAGGCTSGHGITGVADLQPASFLALIGFFAGGIAATFLVLPWLMGSGT